MEGKKIIDNRYIVEQRLGSGWEGVTYLVRDKDSKDNELKYAAKILEFENHEDEEEVEEDENMKITIKKSKEIFSKICTMNPPHPNLIKCISQGKGKITKNGKIKIRNYFIFEYAPKVDLWKMTYLAGGFGERCAKPIFQKILLGVQALHRLGVYHLDLKVDNIVLDKDYNPKICDFGFSTMEKGILNYAVGTINYQPPQMFETPIKYTAEKADIFSLGCVLFALVIGHSWFGSAKKNDEYYRCIYNNEGIEEYFNLLNANNPDVKLLTQDFKNLYAKMIAYKEEDRPSIEEILNDEWFDEIKDLNAEAKEELLKEVHSKCIEKEKKAIDVWERENYVQYESFLSSDTRGEDDDIGIVTFESNLIPKYEKIEFVKDNDYLKIKGKLNHYHFMNKLLDNIRNEFGEDNVEIIANSYKYKCDLNFLGNNNEKEDKEEDDDQKENEEEEEDKQQNYSIENKCIIQIKLYQIGEEEFCLRALRKLGNLSQYYLKVKKIFELSRELL